MNTGVVFVTNKNPETYIDRYNGIDYVFKPETRTILPLLAAQHIFGYGKPDQVKIAENLVRMGKAHHYAKSADGKIELIDTVQEGMKWLKNFLIREGEFIEKPLEKKAQGDPLEDLKEVGTRR